MDFATVNYMNSYINMLYVENPYLMKHGIRFALF